MASTSLMKESHPQAAPMRQTGGHRQPLNGNPSLGSARRWQARDHLTSQIKDRSAKGPVKWSRSLTAVSISNYKSHCREFGDRHLFTRRGNLPAAPHRKDNKSTESNSTAEEYIYKGTANSSKKRASQDSSSEAGSLKEYTRHLTIAELHKLLGNNETQRQRHIADDMKIVINSVPSAYPNIKVTFKDQEHVQADSKIGVKLPAVGPVFPSGQKQISRSAPFKKAIALEPTRRRSNELPLSTKACLAQLDKYRVNSSEWTKRWVAESPLGPGRNDEYERAADGRKSTNLMDQSKHSMSPEESEIQFLSSSATVARHSTIPSTSNTPSKAFSKAPEQREPDEGRKKARKVRFGTDQFLVKDSQSDAFQWH